MKLSLRYIGALIFMFFMISQLKAENKISVYTRWINLPSETLLKMGRNFVNEQDKPDSALLCFTILTNRYDENADKEEKIIIAHGLSSKAFVYIFYYFDYSKAYESLIRAKEICEEVKTEMPSIWMNFGHIFAAVGEQNNDRKTKLVSFNYMKKAFYASLHIKDYNMLNTAFGNELSMANDLYMLDSLRDEWLIYEELENKDKKEYTQFNLYYYKALQSVHRHKDKAAVNLFNAQIKLMKEDATHIRYICIALLNKAFLYERKKSYDEALICLKQNEKYSYRFNMKDVRVETFDEMARCYQMKGDDHSYIVYKNRFFSLRDSLLNYQQIAHINEFRFMSDIKKIDEKMAENKHVRQMMTVALCVLVFIAVIVGLFLLFFYKKNRLLRATNKSLYEKNVEILRLESKERQRREEETAVQKSAAADEEKYKNSSLSEDRKEMLSNRIKNVLETSDEIFATEFSQERLAVLVDSKYKYVSQVINEIFNCNFNTLLNKYRIKEACRRMNNIKEYGNFTIEAISNSVGFKSRSTFICSFKRIVGLTPSEYQRMANNGNM